MTEQNAELTSGETGSASAEPITPPSLEPSIQSVAAPDLVPEQGAAADAPTLDAAEAEVAEARVADTVLSKAEAPAESAKAETPRPAMPRFPGRVLFMSAGARKCDDDSATSASRPSPKPHGKPRHAVAVMLALAVAGGALGGALATAGLSHFVGGEFAAADNQGLEASIARIDADVQALKAGVEHSSKLVLSQYTRTSERLDKVEKAQGEPAARLAKLSEGVDKLRTAPPAIPATVVAKDVTGSIAPPATATVPLPSPKPEVARLPTLEGWVLRDVANGGALIEGRRGIFEVYAGDPVPGLGRIDAIRRQDGRWVVVTSKGLIIAR